MAALSHRHFPTAPFLPCPWARGCWLATALRMAVAPGSPILVRSPGPRPLYHHHDLCSIPKIPISSAARLPQAKGQGAPPPHRRLLAAPNSRPVAMAAALRLDRPARRGQASSSPALVPFRPGGRRRLVQARRPLFPTQPSPISPPSLLLRPRPSFVPGGHQACEVGERRLGRPHKRPACWPPAEPNAGFHRLASKASPSGPLWMPTRFALLPLRPPPAQLLFPTRWPLLLPGFQPPSGKRSGPRPTQPDNSLAALFSPALRPPPAATP